MRKITLNDVVMWGSGQYDQEKGCDIECKPYMGLYKGYNTGGGRCIILSAYRLRAGPIWFYEAIKVAVQQFGWRLYVYVRL